MTDIALSRDVTPDDLTSYLTALLPGVMVDVRALNSPDSLRDCDVAVTIVGNPSEFPCGLSIGVRLTNESATEGWLRELARCLSINFGCRAVCDGSGLGDDSSPYWSIVWDSGAAYLADDSNTVFADGEGGALRILRPLPALGGADRAVDLPGMVRRSNE